MKLKKPTIGKMHKTPLKFEKKKKKFDEIFIVLVVALLIIVVSIYTKKPNSDDAQKITEMIVDHHEISFANNGVIDQQKLNNIRDMNYETLKREFDINGEFCVYIEDENGNLLLAKGSEKLSKDGIYCKE